MFCQARKIRLTAEKVERAPGYPPPPNRESRKKNGDALTGPLLQAMKL
jgi:hypothetical protein